MAVMDLHTYDNTLYEKVYQTAYQAAVELIETAGMKAGQILVVGCSTSEVGGEKIADPELLLSKSALLKIGEPYRFYFQKGSRPVVGNDYLDAALSTNSFLGYEAISEPEEHPDPSSES